MEARRHQLLQEVADRAAAVTAELGLPHDIAAHVGAAVADSLSEHWAGQQVTFPLRCYYGLSPRELAIAERVRNGARVYEIAREFTMTERGVRKLLSRLQVRRPVDQPDLFA